MSYDRFIFEAYQFDREKGEIVLKYSLDEKVHFEEVLTLPHQEYADVEGTLLERALLNLHLIGGISYYKTYCPKEIKIKSGVLSKEEADFWNKLYTQGLGEFFYQNKIDFRDLVKFPFEDGQVSEPVSSDLPDRTLLPLGGGKDSLVAAEMLKERDIDFEVFNLGGYPVVEALADQMGKQLLVVDRKLSKEVFRLNEEGAYNGHIPISAYLAFLSVLVSVLYGFRYIVLANERSANEGNVEFHGTEINHQYSKSFEFEQDFSEYLWRFVTGDIEYFSLLRPYYEIKIAEQFAKHERYFEYFTSCNRNFKVAAKSFERFWCGECPKCAFVYSILAPFVPKLDLVDMFGKNMFDDESLWPLYLELLGENEVKPFDCVGTPEEVRAAFSLASQKGEYSGDAVMEKFEKEIGVCEVPAELFAFSFEHDIPLRFRKVLILGYGREGQASYEYLRRTYPGMLVAIADENPDLELEPGMTSYLGNSYLEHLDEFDLILKSPGIPWFPELEAVSVQVSSATQLFFDRLDPSNSVIGVTGSKGKSTVASLIYELLKADGRKVELVGNIGSPALGRVDLIDTTFVFELSSYQLDRLTAQMDVAVFTSFFPEHLNVHGDIEAYRTAKANITLGQSEEDFFVYHKKDATLESIETDAKRVKVDEVPKIETSLPGQHNQENLALVAAVAEILRIERSVFEKVAKEFKGLPHRLEFVGEHGGILFYDDAISTTPESTLAAIDVFKDEIGTIILGGHDRGYDFSELAKAVLDYGIENVVLFPDSGAKIKPLLDGPLLFETNNMKDAVKFAFEKTPKGKVCLLSTASPSYSIFKNFVEKGELFQRYVKEM